MINHNTLLYDLLDRTFSVDFIGQNWEVNYTEGDLFELSKKLKDSEVKYPIIWLQTGYRVERDYVLERTNLMGCNFFFITKGSTNDRYKQRFRTTYEEVLYKSLVNFDEILRKKKGIEASNTDEFYVYPLNDIDEMSRRDMNNGTKTPSQTVPIGDIWDAIMLQTDISISNSCFPQLKIKK